jgi:lipopolysaccharide transport system ATP-binding protein
MDPIIKVSGLSKRYRIGERVPYRTLRESLMTASKVPRRLAGALVGQANGRKEPTLQNEVWALRDVSFDVMPGEVLGVIGRNGAGKSTLLKILSRITEPTTGKAELHGRVGSLLEVGTGFHPELTGRENVYLSGAILGMHRAEVTRKFDEIVDFAGVEKFVDTPVKRYSSGMYVRLAFAVAAHLETEILLVDEVLAVGDASFQKQCLGKIGDIARQGRTVLFVSHNMASIEALCDLCMLLDRGSTTLIAKPGSAIDEYARMWIATDSGRSDLTMHSGRAVGAVPIMKEVEVRGSAIGTVRIGETLSVSISFQSQRAIRPCCGLTIKTDRGFRIFHVSDRFSEQLAVREPVTEGIVVCELTNLPLMPGRYVIDLWLEDFDIPGDLDRIHDSVTFEVISTDRLGTGRLPPSSEGPLFYRGQWDLRKLARPAMMTSVPYYP